jgi:hypothetical protein
VENAATDFGYTRSDMVAAFDAVGATCQEQSQAAITRDRRSRWYPGSLGHGPNAAPAARCTQRCPRTECRA